MNDETLNAILRRIITEPDEDLHRLTYADQLDELAEDARRVRCESCGGRCSVKATDDVHGRNRRKCKHCHGTGTVFDMTLRDRARFIRSAIANRERGYEHHKFPDAYTTGFDSRIEGIRAEWDRGFIHTIECTAEIFLVHADELIWYEGQTMECPTCEGDDRMFTYTPDRYCRKCGGTGHISRPCPPTAQPIRKVMLTGSDGNLGSLSLWGKSNGKWESAKYPGIEFGFPPDLIEFDG